MRTFDALLNGSLAVGKLLRRHRGGRLAGWQPKVKVHPETSELFFDLQEVKNEGAAGKQCVDLVAQDHEGGKPTGVQVQRVRQLEHVRVALDQRTDLGFFLHPAHLTASSKNALPYFPVLRGRNRPFRKTPTVRVPSSLSRSKNPG